MSRETYWVKKQLMNSGISGWYETYSIPVGNALKNWPGISSRTRTRVVQTTIELHPEVSSWVQKVEPKVEPVESVESVEPTVEPTVVTKTPVVREYYESVVTTTTTKYRVTYSDAISIGSFDSIHLCYDSD